MTERFLDTNASGANDGTSWTDASESMDDLIAIPIVAGDIVYVASDSADTNAGGKTWAILGTEVAPITFISSESGTSSPVVYEKATVSQFQSDSTINIQGSFRMFGIQLEADEIIYSVNDNVYDMEDCVQNLTKNGDGLIAGNTDNMHIIHWKNVDVNFTNATSSASAKFRLVGTFYWEGGTVSVTSANSPTFLFDVLARAALHYLSGVNFNDFTGDFYDASDAVNIQASLSHCDVNSSSALAVGSIDGPWSKYLRTGADDSGGNLIHQLEYVDYYGSIDHDVANFLNASSGIAPISWKMVATSNIDAQIKRALVSPWIPAWNTETTSKTFTIQCMWDNGGSGNINDDEIWMELEYLDASGNTKSVFIDDYRATILTAGAAQSTADGDPGWTETISNQTFFKLHVPSITPGRIGPIRARVHLAKATTVYVDPLITVS